MLVIVTAGVVTLAVLLPVILNRYDVVPPPTPSPGANVDVDAYAPGSNWSGQFGDDPTVAVAPDGTVAVAWEGLYELAPPAEPGGVPSFDTMIFVSLSVDQGQRYSPPVPVGGPGTVAAWEPSLSFASNGTLFLAYVNGTNTGNEQIIVVSAAPGHGFGPAAIAARGQDLSRPWLSVLADATVVLAFGYYDFVEWAASDTGGRSFAPASILLQGVLTGGTVWDGHRVTLVGLSDGALSYTTAGLWSVTFNGTGTGSPEIGTPATLTIPFPVSVGGVNMSRPGPVVAAAGGLLYLVYASENESKLSLETSSTNGSTWAGPWTLWTGRGVSIETPAVAPGPDGGILAVGWQSTDGAYWETYAALFSVHTGLLSTPAIVSSADSFPSTVRNWHGTTMALGILGSYEFLVAWGDGRGLSGAYGLTHIYACSVAAELT